MSIEEEVYFQSELFGEFPVIPNNQWECIQDELIKEQSDNGGYLLNGDIVHVEVTSGFQKDLNLGLI